MRTYLKINAGAADVGRELLDFEKWPSWWPGVSRAKVLERGESRAVVELVISLRLTISMTLEFDFARRDSIRFVQRRGWFKSYAVRWDLLSSQEGSGSTILKITTDLTCGPLIPTFLVWESISDSYEMLEKKLNQRLQNRVPSPVPAAPEGRPAEEVKEAGEKAILFPTRKGVEVWIEGRRHLLKYTGWSGRGWKLVPAHRGKTR